ncbi:hypothetical protein DNR46_28060 [Mesorhizobium japonicum]|uniref:Uncharacterized protein n=1 Tax=Mesorhizobium japonicum TaxID=2066070 RepID=A0A3M9X3L1_9HYPH|nr:hypothetical protein DNR46_28060 [Mesorhizobium japonicum]
MVWTGPRSRWRRASAGEGTQLAGFTKFGTQISVSRGQGFQVAGVWQSNAEPTRASKEAASRGTTRSASLGGRFCTVG